MYSQNKDEGDSMFFFFSEWLTTSEQSIEMYPCLEEDIFLGCLSRWKDISVQHSSVLYGSRFYLLNLKANSGPLILHRNAKYT